MARKKTARQRVISKIAKYAAKYHLAQDVNNKRFGITRELNDDERAIITEVKAHVESVSNGREAPDRFMHYNVGWLISLYREKYAANLKLDEHDYLDSLPAKMYGNSQRSRFENDLVAEISFETTMAQKPYTDAVKEKVRQKTRQAFATVRPTEDDVIVEAAFDRYSDFDKPQTVIVMVNGQPCLYTRRLEGLITVYKPAEQRRTDNQKLDLPNDGNGRPITLRQLTFSDRDRVQKELQERFEQGEEIKFYTRPREDNRETLYEPIFARGLHVTVTDLTCNRHGVMKATGQVRLPGWQTGQGEGQTITAEFDLRDLSLHNR